MDLEQQGKMMDFEQEEKGVVIEYIDDDEESPIFQHPYYRNRMLLCLVQIAFIFSNTFWLHGKIADTIVHGPNDNKSFWERGMGVRRNAQNFTRVAIEELRQLSDQFRLDLNEITSHERLRVQDMLAQNRDMIQNQVQVEKNIQAAHEMATSYLQAWAALGNAIPYYPHVNREEQILLEAQLSIDDPTIVNELHQDSVDLKSGIYARTVYDREYFRNKTSIPNILSALVTPLQLPTSLQTDISDQTQAVKDATVAALLELRSQLRVVFDSVLRQLSDTQLSVDAFAERYQRLISTVTEFYTILDGINLVGFDVNAFPAIDLSEFPSAGVLRPDSIPLPDTNAILQPIDDAIRQLDDSFNGLSFDIFTAVRSTWSLQVDQALEQLASYLTLDDYNPPPILYKGKNLDPDEALLVDLNITSDLVGSISAPDIPFPNDDATLVIVPDVTLNSTTFNYIQPNVMWLGISFDFEAFLETISMILMFLSEWWFSVEVVILNIIRAAACANEYIEGSAVPLPVIDLRTKAETVDKKKRRRKRGKVGSFMNIIFHPDVKFFVVRFALFVLFGIATAVVCWGFNNEYRQGCVLSMDGTYLGNELVAPGVGNFALIGVQTVATQATAENLALAQTTCQAQGQATHSVFVPQVGQFESSQAKQQLLSQRFLSLFESIDLNALCDSHTDACQDGSNPSLACPGNTTHVDPCELSVPSVSEEELLDVFFDCSLFPDDSSLATELDDLGERAKRELHVQEEWCMIESDFWSRVIKFMMVVAGFFTAAQASHLMITGLQTVYWDKLRPKGFTINCTCDENGNWTQPEYSDPEAKKVAVQQWKRSNKRSGIFKVVFGVLLFLGFAAALILIWHYTGNA